MLETWGSRWVASLGMAMTKSLSGDLPPDVLAAPPASVPVFAGGVVALPPALPEFPELPPELPPPQATRPRVITTASKRGNNLFMRNFLRFFNIANRLRGFTRKGGAIQQKTHNTQQLSQHTSLTVFSFFLYYNVLMIIWQPFSGRIDHFLHMLPLTQPFFVQNRK